MLNPFTIPSYFSASYSGYRILYVWFFLFFMQSSCVSEHPSGLSSSGDTSEMSQTIPNERQLALEQMMYFAPDSAIAQAKIGLEALDTLHTYMDRIFYYNIIAGSYIYQAQYKNALAYVHQHLELAIQEGNMRNVAEAYHNLGFIYSNTRHYKDAVDFMLKAIDIYDDIGDDVNFHVTHNNLGRLYYDIGDPQKTRYHFNKAYQWFHEEEMELFMPAVSNHMAMYFAWKEQPDSALWFFDEAIRIATQSNNNYGLSIIYNIKGNFYLDQGMVDEALFIYQKSDSIAELYNFVSQDCFPKLGMARAWLIRGHTAHALENAEAALLLANDIDNNDLRYLTMEVLSQIYETKGDYRKAHGYYKHSSALKTRLYEETGIYQVYNIEAERLSEQMALKEVEMEKQQLLLSKRQNSLLLTIIVAFLLVVIISLAYYFYMNKLRHREREKRHRREILYSREKNFAVMEAETHERKRLASELHDGIGTQLSLAKLTLANVLDKQELSLDKKSGLIQSTVKSIDEVIREVKSISHTMTPLALAEKGLKEAIKELVAQYSKIRNSKISLSIVGLNGSLKPYQEHALYRTVQEVLTNAIKHARSSEITIQMQQYPDELTVMIEDDGCGFDPRDTATRNGQGLKNAASRIESLNGQFLVDSMVNRGTIVTVVLPTGDKVP